MDFLPASVQLPRVNIRDEKRKQYIMGEFEENLTNFPFIYECIYTCIGMCTCTLRVHMYCMYTYNLLNIISYHIKTFYACHK